MGILDINKKYKLNEIVSGDSIFCATGITPGELVNGIFIKDNIYTSETLVTHKNSNFKKIINRSEEIILWYRFPKKILVKKKLTKD